jgi:hypothetical protein
MPDISAALSATNHAPVLKILVAKGVLARSIIAMHRIVDQCCVRPA